MKNLKLIITMLCFGPFILRGATLDGVVIRCSQSDTRLRPSVATGSELKNGYTAVINMTGETADVTPYKDNTMLGPKITLPNPTSLKFQDVVDSLTPKYAGVSKRFILGQGIGEILLKNAIGGSSGQYRLSLTLEDIDNITLRHYDTNDSLDVHITDQQFKVVNDLRDACKSQHYSTKPFIEPLLLKDGEELDPTALLSSLRGDLIKVTEVDYLKLFLESQQTLFLPKTNDSAVTAEKKQQMYSIIETFLKGDAVLSFIPEESNSDCLIFKDRQNNITLTYSDSNESCTWELQYDGCTVNPGKLNKSLIRLKFAELAEIIVAGNPLPEPTKSGLLTQASKIIDDWQKARTKQSSAQQFKMQLRNDAACFEVIDSSAAGAQQQQPAVVEKEVDGSNKAEGSDSSSAANDAQEQVVAQEQQLAGAKADVDNWSNKAEGSDSSSAANDTREQVVAQEQPPVQQAWPERSRPPLGVNGRRTLPPLPLGTRRVPPPPEMPPEMPPTAPTRTDSTRPKQRSRSSTGSRGRDKQPL